MRNSYVVITRYAVTMNLCSYEMKILFYETLFLFHTFFVDLIEETFAIIGEGEGVGGGIQSHKTNTLHLYC